MKTTYFTRLQKYPPCLIRLLARNPDGTAMTDRAVCSVPVADPVLYLPLYKVVGLSLRQSWDDVDTADADAFLHACGADPLDVNWVKRVNRLIKQDAGTKWTWLRRAPHFEQLKPYLAAYAATLK